MFCATMTCFIVLNGLNSIFSLKPISTVDKIAYGRFRLCFVFVFAVS